MNVNQFFLVLIGLVPSVVWLIFFWYEDAKRPEPKGLLFSTFIWGGIITFYVLPIQIIIRNLLVATGVGELDPIFLAWLAGIEEILKFAIVFLWINRRKDFDEPIDAMIYMIVAALGFAAVENVATALKASNSFELMTMRFIGATLLHSLASGIVGYYWAKGIIKGRLWPSVVLGLFWATVIHAIFNYLMLTYGPGIKITSFLIFLAFFVLVDFEILKKPHPIGLRSSSRRFA